MPPTTCPSADVLRQLFLGRLGQEDLASIEGHVAACAACAETLSALNVSDTLLEPVKAQPAVAERMAPPRVTLAASVEAAVQGIVQGIVEHPQAMPERPAARSTLSASAGVERTTGLNGEADDAGENHDEDEDANYDFLAPPRAAGELGWLGPYRVLRVLGRGGMGMVFEAEDPQLRRHVALKVMKPGIAASSSARKRFLREAQAAAAVEHDHIVAIYQVGDERGVPFIAMPLLRGQTLAQRLRNAELQPLTPNAQRLTPNAQRLTLPLAELLRIAREVALGLAAAHERGLIHRDVKPANIWLEEKTGRVKLLDFGLARAAQAGEQLTQAGTLLGTPSYMAPEQAKGGPTDERADLFSLGCVLYQMASGQTPFAGRDALSILLAVTSQEPRPPRELNVELPAAVNDLIVALLSKEPAGRPQTAQEVVEHLRAIEADFVGQVSNLPSAEPTQRLSWDGLPRPSFSVGNALRGVPPGGVSPALTWHAAPFAARRVPRLPLLIAAAAGALLLAGIIIVIRNKDGSIARTVEVGPDQTATIEQHAASLPSADRGHGGEPSAVPAGKDGRRATSRADATDPMPGGAKAEPAAPLADSATLLADDPLPFVVLRPAGEPRRFKHFSAVLAVLRDGDEIEVHGNGPFKVPQVQLKNKGLVIRAAAGYRPRFVPAADVNGWFILDGGPLTVEGCDLEPGNRYFFLGGGAPWTIRNCRILKTNVGTIEYDGPKLSISDSYLCGTSIGVAGGAQVDLSGNIACMSNFILILGPKAGAGRKVRLTRNTFSRCGPVVTLQNGDPTGDGVEIEAVGNIFDCDTAVWDRRADGVKITWQGRDNLYGPNAMHLDAEGLRSPTDPVHMSPPQNLTDWAQYWGHDEPGSRQVERFVYQYDSVAIDPPPHSIATLRRLSDELHAKYGEKLAGVGPDWDLVGPGEAYLRALALAGRPVPDDKLRPEPPEEGPFVVTRGDAPPRGYPTLPEAVQAAANGDVEIRVDGLFESGDIHGQGSELTIRAAPGFVPVLEGALRVFGVSRLVVEGVEFRGAGIDVNEAGAASVRIANCSFDGAGGLGGVTHGTTPPQFEIDNSFVASQVRFYHLTQGGEWTIHNSLVGRIINFGPHPQKLRFDRSLLWYPLQAGIPVEGGEVEARGSWFELAERSETLPRAWSGSRNFYRTAAGQPWLDILKRDAKIVEEGSFEADSLFCEPAQWRLLAIEPNPDGAPLSAEIGANVDRVARTATPESQP